MSGPPVPHPDPAPLSNTIGSFQIGVSPIGDISTFDPWATVINQYANSPILTAIINSFNAAVDQTQDLSNFFDDIWNILTAQGYGLEVWGRILNVSRTIPIPVDGSFLGFNEASSWTGFNQGPFFGGGSQLTQNVILSDTDFRTLLLAKAASNISDGSIPSINAILLSLFPGRGPCWVVDNENMTLTYAFSFTLSSTDLAIILLSGVLPTGAGVSASVQQGVSPP